MNKKNQQWFIFYERFIVTELEFPQKKTMSRRATRETQTKEDCKKIRMKESKRWIYTRHTHTNVLQCLKNVSQTKRKTPTNPRRYYYKDWNTHETHEFLIKTEQFFHPSSYLHLHRLCRRFFLVGFSFGKTSSIIKTKTKQRWRYDERRRNENSLSSAINNTSFCFSTHTQHTSSVTTTTTTTTINTISIQ